MKLESRFVEFEELSPLVALDSLISTRKMVGSGSVVDALFCFRKNTKKLVVLLPSAQPANKEVVNPNFHRWSWFSQLRDVSFVCLSDPTLNFSSARCGWFLGDGGADCIGDMSVFLDELFDLTGFFFESLVIYGSSMGGFGALMLAARRADSVALAEVPQLDLRKYPHKSAISEIELSILKESIESYSNKNLRKVSVVEAFKVENRVPPFTLITNMSDSEYESHILFLSEIKSIVSGCNSVGRFDLIVHDDCQGHRPLETKTAIEYLKSRLNLGFVSKEVSLEIDVGCKAKTYKEIIDLAVSECNKVRFVRDEVDAEIYSNALSLLKKAADIEKSADWPYLKMCSMTKLWTNSFNKDIMSFAMEALSRKQSLEGFLYACRGILANYDVGSAKERIFELMGKCSSGQVSNAGNVFLAICAYDSGDYELYSSYIKEFQLKKADDFDFYLSIPLSTCYLGEWVGESEYPPSEVNIASTPMRPAEFYGDDIRYVVSVSCDQGYFDDYAEYIIKSFTRHCSSESVMHLSLVNADSFLVEKRLTEWGAKNVVFSIHNFETSNNIPPIASLARFSLVYPILARNKIPVIVLDLDCVIKKPLLGIVEEFSKCDVGSRVLGKGVAPWERYTGGFALFNPTEYGLSVSRNVAYAASRVCKLSEKQWWIDQNCFEAGIRSALGVCGFSLQNMYSARDKYCVMPVGSGDAKKHFLDKAIREFVSGVG